MSVTLKITDKNGRGAVMGFGSGVGCSPLENLKRFLKELKAGKVDPDHQRHRNTELPPWYPLVVNDELLGDLRPFVGKRLTRVESGCPSYFCYVVA